MQVRKVKESKNNKCWINKNKKFEWRDKIKYKKCKINKV